MLISEKMAMEWLPQAQAHPELVLQAIQLAHSRANTFCRRTLELDEHKEWISTGAYQWEVYLHDYPVVAMLELSANDYPLTEKTDYILNYENGSITKADGSLWNGVRLFAHYTAGYDLNTCPPDLQQALLQLVGWIIGSRGDAGIQQDSLDGYSRTMELVRGGIPQSIASALKPYRRLI